MSANAIGLRAYKLPRNKTTHVQPHAYMNICTTTGADGLAASKKDNGAGKGQAKPTLKRPAAAVSGKLPACPGINGGPVLYKSAKVSYSASKGGWRIWLDKTNVSAEKTVKGGPEAWDRVTKMLKEL